MALKSKEKPVDHDNQTNQIEPKQDKPLQDPSLKTESGIQSETKSAGKEKVSSTLLIWSVTTVIMLAAGWVSIWQLKRHDAVQNVPYVNSGIKGIIAIDSPRIFNHRLKAFMATDAASSDKTTTLNTASAFGQQFHDIVQAYQKQGYLVINSHAILAGPADMDKTEEVAKKLGITLNDTDNK